VGAYSRILLPWDSQPQGAVGLSDFAQCLGCVSATLASQRSFDVARQKEASIVDGGVAYVPSPYGIAQRGSTVADGAALDAVGFTGLFPVAPATWSVMILARVATTGSRRIIAADYGAAGTGESFVMEQRSGNDWRFYIVTPAPATRTLTGGAVSVGWHWLEFTCDGASLYGFDNGAQFATTTIPASLRTGTDYRIGRGGAFTSLGFDGDIAAHFVFSQLVDGSARAEIRNDPWSLFAPRSIWVPTYTPPPGVPLLSSPTLTSIASTSARPQVSITFP
jgi:hypothetical protein